MPRRGSLEQFSRGLAARCVLLAALGTALSPQAASALPPGFVDTCILCDWNRAIGLAFAPDGRLFVSERDGRVWIVENGVKAATPLIDISEECLKWGDLGLLGFALDPHFDENGFLYLFYAADHHYVTQFGLPGYMPGFDANRATIGRVTRYQADAADNFNSIVPGSRTILIGETLSTGIPITARNHGGGGLAFGEDGSLLVGAGDGASLWDTGGCIAGTSCTGIADGIITPKEDVGPYRAQLVDSLSGKILRIDPDTGDGLHDNPFFDPAAPRAPRSRVWALGARNPFRLSVRPGSSHDRHANSPGAIYVGDVGWFKWEEIQVSRGEGGENFGWPLYDGLLIQDIYNGGPGYYYQDVYNQDAPNPLYGTTPPGQGLCDQPFFRFRDLIHQDTLLENPSYPNPCDPTQQVPANILKHIHTRPKIEFRHNSLLARTPTYTGTSATINTLGSVNSPVTGAPFQGECVIGGTWYSEGIFPEEYHDTYFQADWSSGWIRNFVFDEEDRLTAVREFAANGFGAIVAMAVHPSGNAIYYIDYDRNIEEYQLRSIEYAPGNLRPTAVATADVTFGPAQLPAQFTGSASSDPESGPLRYEWDFGDGTPPSRLADPLHRYLTDDITATGTIVARLFELAPPTPQGDGATDAETIRDGVYPDLGDTDPRLQYDTTHGGDQGSVDWIGYTFPAARTLRGVVFVEGLEQPDGGWFDTLAVEVRVGGSWTPVTGLAVAPAYPGANGVDWEMFEFAFDPVAADGVRLIGDPGGSTGYIGVGELRVLADPIAQPTAATNYVATLTVTDDGGLTRSAQVTISLNNSPPEVTITSPTDGALYSIQIAQHFDLEADITDAEHALGTLACRWRTILHHEDHIHVEYFENNCSSEGVTEPLGCADELYFFEFDLLVTDPLGLSTLRSVYLYPDCAATACATDADCLDGISCTADACVNNACVHGPCLHPVVGDLDCNHDVNTADLALFAAHMTGPCSAPCLSGDLPACAANGDADGDGDYDLADYAAMQRTSEVGGD